MTSIYDAAKIKCRTFIESINALFNMGKDLETKVNGIDTTVSGKQDTLVSGTNIKSINGTSILGSGNVVIEGDNPGIVAGDAGKALVVNAGETGAEWSKDVRVNTNPVDASSAVNAAYVNDATDGVNNIVHKSGVETIGGQKFWENSQKYNYGLERYHDTMDISNPVTTWTKDLIDTDVNENDIGRLQFHMRSNGTTAYSIRVRNSDGSFDEILLGEGRVIE